MCLTFPQQRPPHLQEILGSARKIPFHVPSLGKIATCHRIGVIFTFRLRNPLSAERFGSSSVVPWQFPQNNNIVIVPYKGSSLFPNVCGFVLPAPLFSTIVLPSCPTAQAYSGWTVALDVLWTVRQGGFVARSCARTTN